MKIAIAYSVFFAFLPFAILVFQRLPKAQAAATVVLTGSILMPERIAVDLPAIPPIDKEYLTYLSAFIGAYVFRRNALVRARPGRGMESVVVLLFVANIATAMMNGESMMDEGRREDALGLYWILASTVDDLLRVALPFFVGRALFTSLDDLYVFMRTLVLAGVGYTGLIAIEVLMSIPFRVWHLSEVLFDLPGRLNMRWGMAQPVVFFDNGLALATFMAGALIAASAIAKANLPLPRVGKSLGLPKLGSGMARNLTTAGLIMTRNVAGVVYGTSFLLAYVFGRPRLVALLGFSLVTLACIYPTLRMADLFPYEPIVDFAASIDAERAHSLEGRFLEEEHVLSQIGDRLWLGWGTYSRIPGAETFGQGEVGLDGWVTIRLGTSGVIGVALYYMVFALPAFQGFRRMHRAGRAGGILLGALGCMLSIRMIDLIINGWWNCLPIFFAGVLAGVAGNLKPGDRLGGPRRKRRAQAPAQESSDLSTLLGVGEQRTVRRKQTLASDQDRTDDHRQSD